MTDMTSQADVAKLRNALPFWVSLTFVPLVALGIYFGGWFLLIVPAYGLGVFSLLDYLGGLNAENADPATSDDDLYWYRLITLLWFPVQLLLVFASLFAVAHLPYLSVSEKFLLMYGVGVISGAIGIVYAHELMHQSTRLERHLADGLLAMVLYGHFRSEHLLVHHPYVGTPRDPVTARYNDGFHRFFPRILVQCFRSSWRAEKAMLARKGLPVWHRSNPFYKYFGLQMAFVLLAWLVAGQEGILFFGFQALIAVLYLELVNYVEHYGLTRKYLGDGKYEHTQPHHSWNDSHKATSWMLINLQRHSDHHVKPNRRFPLLQAYPVEEAPQLPYGYIGMTFAAMIPPLWRRIMNKRVREWRAVYYPEIDDWTPYKAASNPMPKGAS